MDSKSTGLHHPCGFDSRPRHQVSLTFRRDMDSLLKFLNEYQGLISATVGAIGVIVSPIVAFKVMRRTLTQQAEQFSIQRKDEERRHNESLAKQQEQNRIYALPFFVLNKSGIKPYIDEHRLLVFHITLTNKGNGTAIHLRADIKEDSDNSNTLTMYESPVACYKYHFPFSVSGAVVQPGDTSSFEMSCEFTCDDDYIADEVRFAVLFSDMYFNEYKQEFTFLFQKKKSGNATVEIMDNYSSRDPTLQH